MAWKGCKDNGIERLRCDRKSCGLDELESDLFTCDPAGVFFEDTLAALDVKDCIEIAPFRRAELD